VDPVYHATSKHVKYCESLQIKGGLSRFDLPKLCHFTQTTMLSLTSLLQNDYVTKWVPLEYQKYFNLQNVYEPLIDFGVVPDILLRHGVRQLLRYRIKLLSFPNLTEQDEAKMSYVESIKSQVIALSTDEANEQHYQLPTEFFRYCLGSRLKYSCAYYETGARDLDEAEEAMLDVYCSRAQLRDGLSILDLGCGWGSLTLYLCERYPNANITSISNSATQRQYIEKAARERGFRNVKVVTADINLFTTQDKFDRICSIEMFEHMKNYPKLFDKVLSMLKPGKWSPPISISNCPLITEMR
jgi:cyclopropane-fatty-acyl-phospholipid synthase